VRTGAMVRSITKAGGRWRVRTAEADYVAESVIFAAPTFLVPYVVEGVWEWPRWVYSPWLTANLTVENAEELGETAWDNVIYQSPALGYVVATHQSLRRHVPRSVWTFYWALTGDAAAQRRWLLGASWGELKERVLRELERAHPAMRRHVSRMDIFRQGHAMRRPVPGAARGERVTPPGIFLANSDLSGLPLFEEAQYRGVRAAERVYQR
jgi:protoporphyrinogen oxidase